VASGHLRFVAILTILLLIAAPISCVKVRGPGIMPPVEESGSGEWLIQSMGYQAISTRTGEIARQWSIIARYNPDEGKEGITALEITAAVDNEPVPFTFEEDAQLLESAVSPFLSPGVHEFFLGPSDSTARPFPTLRVRFEAP
jgi:hypothetical protein